MYVCLGACVRGEGGGRGRGKSFPSTAVGDSTNDLPAVLIRHPLVLAVVDTKVSGGRRQPLCGVLAAGAGGGCNCLTAHIGCLRRTSRGGCWLR
jgi:hypothetical protein